LDFIINYHIRYQIGKELESEEVQANMAKAKNDSIAHQEQALLNELSQLIEQSQRQVLVQANSALTMLFWHIANASTITFCKTNGQTMESKSCRHCLHN